MKIKKYILVPVIVILCVIGYALTTKPTIEKHIWVLSYAQQTEPPHSVVAHNADYDFSKDDSSLYEFSKPIELTLTAKGGELILTDTTNDQDYKGTYTINPWNKFVSQSYSVFIDGVDGTANVVSKSGKQLFVSIDDYNLYFVIQ